VPLDERDWQRIVTVVAEAAAGTADEPLPRDVLAHVRALFTAADTVAFFDGAPWDRETRRRWIEGGFEPWTSDEMAVVDAFRFQIPTYPMGPTGGQAIRLTDRMSPREYRRTEIYALAGRRHGVEYAMDFWQRTPDGHLRGLTFDASRRDFSDRERAILDVLGPALARVAGRFDAGSRLPPGLPLTPRQREIVGLVARGLTNTEIARRLWLSPHTVRKHLENAYAALGVRNRAGAVALLFGARAANDARSTKPKPIAKDR
jgi:DNA-binding CsgD family transcriptional regulator